MDATQNKIEAKDYIISDVLSKKKYTIDYFQREYKWQKKHIEQLLADLESSFLNNYQEEHERREVANYNAYYLGPIVLSKKDGKLSVIDGQQRLTSLTILLIYLNNLQKDRENQVKIDDLIYSEAYGDKSFNLDVPERQECLKALHETGEYTIKDTDDETVTNIVERYADIASFFPDELKEKALPFFIDWLVRNVVLVVITAYSEDNAYTIFETMNDRGLNLSHPELLKGFLLSKVKDEAARTRVNNTWKSEIKQLHEYHEDLDLPFFQSWLRGKYAETIRPGKVGAVNEDFEKIGTRFHTWVKENKSKIGLSSSSDFENFVIKDMTFYMKVYRLIWEAESNLTPGLEHLHYADHWGFADSLRDPLILASVKKSDDDETIKKKLNMVSRFVETFCVYRAANFRNFSQSSIRYTMYKLVLEIRNKTIEELGTILSDNLKNIKENLSGLQNLRMHGQNKGFIKFFLARITAHIEQQSGMPTTFSHYMKNTEGKPFEIEHIWANKPEQHEEELPQLHEFNEVRNKIGDLLLLPRGTNQSFGDTEYAEKHTHYIKENLLAKSLVKECYEKNPNFRNYVNRSELPFKAHPKFKKADIEERQNLYYAIAEEVWNLDFFKNT